MTEEEEHPLLLMQTTSNPRHLQNLLLILMIVKKLKLIDICIFVKNESYVFVQLSRKMSNFEIGATTRSKDATNGAPGIATNVTRSY